MQNEDLAKTVADLKRRIQNLELFALAVLIGAGAYVTAAADSWFAINSGQSIVFGVAFTFCLLVLFLRHHIAELLSRAGLNERVTNLLLGGASVVGMAYLLPALITTLQ
ncbi:hypothetical protein Poly24_54930 [Rosistilla carotiformis]|uniref:Uncharacterized protein n=1 Tax=Rosistilla carotiformis TaxID=2528017 RepID=A0A518K1S0_9BACT|nr:hypothetical protein [Rosistilla carotiformis]QDV71753.1 hypothetical protein Poly24_54930 [Rosistilla carotiformis]